MSGGGVHIIFYLNVFLLCGVFLRHFFKRVSSFIPYTVLLMLIGALLGFAAKHIQGELDTAADAAAGSGSASGSTASSTGCAGSGSGSGSVGGNSTAAWATPQADFLNVIDMLGFLDPHTMLYIFLPALLFESAQVHAAAPDWAHR